MLIERKTAEQQAGRDSTRRAASPKVRSSRQPKPQRGAHCKAQGKPYPVQPWVPSCTKQASPEGARHRPHSQDIARSPAFGLSSQILKSQILFNPESRMYGSSLSPVSNPEISNLRSVCLGFALVFRAARPSPRDRRTTGPAHQRLAIAKWPSCNKRPNVERGHRPATIAQLPPPHYCLPMYVWPPAYCS